MNGFTVRPVLAPAFYAFWLLITIIFYEGLPGLRPFANMEAFLIVLAGTAAIVGASHRICDLVKAIWHSIVPTANEEQAVKDSRSCALLHLAPFRQESWALS